MPTLCSALLTQVRYHLNEPVATFWSDAELLVYLNAGIKHLWRRIGPLYEDHFFTRDVTNVSLAASASSLTGVPADVAYVIGIFPRTRASAPNLRFIDAQRYNNPKMEAARGQATMDPASGGDLYYAVTGAGGPVAAPTIYVAPVLTSTLPLEFVYVPNLAAVTGASSNPVPGESDQALVSWVVAHALARSSDTQAPDPSWLTLYGKYVEELCAALDQRTQDDDVFVEAMFEEYWG